MLEERGGAKRRSDRGAKQGEPKHIWVGWEPSFGRRYKKAFLRSLLSDHPTEILGRRNIRRQPRSVGLVGGCSLFSCLTADGKGVKDSLLSCLPIISPAPLLATKLHLPVPEPSSPCSATCVFPITFLCFLCNCRAQQFPHQKAVQRAKAVTT